MTLRAVLALAAALLLLLVPVADAAAQPGVPEIGIVSADLRQRESDVLLSLRLTAPLPAGQPGTDRSRSICVTLVRSPKKVARRLCVRRRRSKITLRQSRMGRSGRFGPARTVAVVRARGASLSARVPARRISVDLGRRVAWKVALRWPCAGQPALPCTSTAAGTLRTRHVRPLAGRRHLRVLATGDSQIQIVDSFLKQRLSPRGARVKSDAHISTGLTKPAMLNWPRKAKDQASSFKPDVTVVFIGANDGFPIGGAQCCTRAWIRGYARRVEQMMRSYRRRGRSLVYWVTLPIPRRDNLRRVFVGVNAAIRRAAKKYPDEVRLLDFEKRFTPGGAFRQNLTFHGITISARQPDGTHLSTSGASMAASLIIEQIQRDGGLRR